MEHAFQSVCVLGLGYIGLPTSAIFANRGLTVSGVDVRADVVDIINRGKIHIEEPGLDVAVHAAVSSGKFKAGLEPQPADAFIIAVPTPFRTLAGGDAPSTTPQPDLQFVEQAAEAVARVVRPGQLVILESTSPPGTTERVAEILRARTGLDPAADLFVAHCPERVLPGRTLEELISNDRVIGGLTPAAARRARDLYGVFVQGRILLTDARTAEFTKLIENTYRDVNIALANELSMVAERLGLNVWEAIRLANHHPRVKILSPGPGVGGHCIPVDPWFIVASAPQEARLIRTAREVNDSKIAFVENQILAAAEKVAGPAGGTVAPAGQVLLLGLAYKANVDDFRESPALSIARSLTLKLGRAVSVHDPYLSAHAEIATGLHIGVDLPAALNAAKVVALLTDHKRYCEIEPRLLSGKVLIDTRGAWNFAPKP